MKCPTVVIKVYLYTEDEDGDIRPFTEEEAQETLEEFQHHFREIDGFAVQSVELIEEEVVCDEEL